MSTSSYYYMLTIRSIIDALCGEEFSGILKTLITV